MFVCKLQHVNGTTGELHKNHSFEWELKLSNGTTLRSGLELVKHTITDVEKGELTVIEGVLPKILD